MKKSVIAHNVMLAVCYIFDVDPVDMASKTRLGPVVKGKKAVAFILRNHYQFTAQEIVAHTPEPGISDAQVYRRLAEVTEMLQSNRCLIFKELVNTVLNLLQYNFQSRVIENELLCREFSYKKRGFRYRKNHIQTEIQNRIQLKNLTREEIMKRDNKLADEKFYSYIVFLNF